MFELRLSRRTGLTHRVNTQDVTDPACVSRVWTVFHVKPSGYGSKTNRDGWSGRGPQAKPNSTRAATQLLGRRTWTYPDGPLRPGALRLIPSLFSNEWARAAQVVDGLVITAGRRAFRRSRGVVTRCVDGVFRIPGLLSTY